MAAPQRPGPGGEPLPPEEVARRQQILEWTLKSRIASIVGDATALQQCVTEGMDVNAVHIQGILPLVMFPAFNGNDKTMAVLLERGVKYMGGVVSMRPGPTGPNPANIGIPQLACLFGYHKILDQMLDRSIEDWLLGKVAPPTPLAGPQQRLPRFDNVLHCAAAGAQSDMLDALVTRAGMDPHTPDCRARDLLEAACAGLRAFTTDILDIVDHIFSPPMVSIGAVQLQPPMFRFWPRGLDEATGVATGMVGDEAYSIARASVRATLRRIIFEYGVGVRPRSPPDGRSASAEPYAPVTRAEVAAAAAAGAYQRYGEIAIKHGNREALQFLLEEGLLLVAPLAELGKLQKPTPAPGAAAATAGAGDAAAAGATLPANLNLLSVVQTFPSAVATEGLVWTLFRLCTVHPRKQAFELMAIPCAAVARLGTTFFDDTAACGSLLVAYAVLQAAREAEGVASTSTSAVTAAEEEEVGFSGSASASSSAADAAASPATAASSAAAAAVLSPRRRAAILEGAASVFDSLKAAADAAAGAGTGAAAGLHIGLDPTSTASLGPLLAHCTTILEQKLATIRDDLSKVPKDLLTANANARAEIMGFFDSVRAQRLQRAVEAVISSAGGKAFVDYVARTDKSRGGGAAGAASAGSASDPKLTMGSVEGQGPSPKAVILAALRRSVELEHAAATGTIPTPLSESDAGSASNRALASLRRTITAATEGSVNTDADVVQEQSMRLLQAVGGYKEATKPFWDALSDPRTHSLPAVLDWCIAAASSTDTPTTVRKMLGETWQATVAETLAKLEEPAVASALLSASSSSAEVAAATGAVLQRTQAWAYSKASAALGPLAAFVLLRVPPAAIAHHKKMLEERKAKKAGAAPAVEDTIDEEPPSAVGKASYATDDKDEDDDDTPPLPVFEQLTRMGFISPPEEVRSAEDISDLVAAAAATGAATAGGVSATGTSAVGAVTKSGSSSNTMFIVVAVIIVLLAWILSRLTQKPSPAA